MERPEADMLGDTRSLVAASGGGAVGRRGGMGVEVLEAEILRLAQEGERMSEELIRVERGARDAEEKVGHG